MSAAGRHNEVRELKKSCNLLHVIRPSAAVSWLLTAEPGLYYDTTAKCHLIGCGVGGATCETYVGAKSAVQSGLDLELPMEVRRMGPLTGIKEVEMRKLKRGGKCEGEVES